MLTKRPTKKMLTEWKRVFEENRGLLLPNRKTGAELDRYFRGKYTEELFVSEKAHNVVRDNIMMNDFFRDKLPENTLPDIRTYMFDGALVGIDLISGFFLVECEDMAKAALIYDDLFVFRGLDADDINNVFLVAEYIRLTR